jgi:hypothetical protein
MVFATLFGLVFAAFGLAWAIGAGAIGLLFGQYGGMVGLIGLPFVAIGVMIACSPIWMRRQVAKTVYFLTDRRAVIMEPGLFRAATVSSYRPDRLTSITRTERPDGSGDLIFEQFTTGHGSGCRTVRRGFVDVRNVREVEALVNRVVDADRQQRGGQIDRPT